MTRMSFKPEVAQAEQAKLRAERFTLVGDKVRRSVTLRSGKKVHTFESLADACVAGPGVSLGAVFSDLWLRRKRAVESAALPLTIADLFSGCGGLSVGAHEAARATGYRAVHVLAVDSNESAMNVYADNFREADVRIGRLEDIVDGDLGSRPTVSERRLAERFAGLDLVIGGPPCQGNSDLNNHTRRQDPRNALYLRMVRFIEVVRPRLVAIENVPGVVHDKSRVVDSALKTLRSVGYSVDAGVVAATDFGAAQLRRRHFLLGSIDPSVKPEVDSLVDLFGAEPRSVLEAIGDIGVEPELGTFGTSARHSLVNQKRIAYLFKHDLHELPDSERPDCHRLKPHSYTAVYGRMYGNRPAPTITAGFGSTGQGRFVHPSEPRTLTPHEAARIQGFPDWFSFSEVSGRRDLQKMIGNAVPSRLAYAAISSILL